MSLSRLFLGGVIGLTLCSFGFPAFANPNSKPKSKTDQTSLGKPIIYQDVPDLFLKTLNYESGNFFENDSVESQLEWLFGVTPSGDKYRFPDFPESEIARDAQAVHTLYEDYLKYQNGAEPIRTRDLKNPYDTSVRSSDFFQ